MLHPVLDLYEIFNAVALLQSIHATPPGGQARVIDDDDDGDASRWMCWRLSDGQRDWWDTGAIIRPGKTWVGKQQTIWPPSECCATWTRSTYKERVINQAGLTGQRNVSRRDRKSDRFLPTSVPQQPNHVLIRNTERMETSLFVGIRELAFASQFDIFLQINFVNLTANFFFWRVTFGSKFSMLNWAFRRMFVPEEHFPK